MGRSLDVNGIKEMLYCAANIRAVRWDQVADRCLSLLQLHDGVPTCFCPRSKISPIVRAAGGALAQMGFLLYDRFLLYPRQQRALDAAIQISPVDDA